LREQRCKILVYPWTFRFTHPIAGARPFFRDQLAAVQALSRRFCLAAARPAASALATFLKQLLKKTNFAELTAEFF
jgi:hypothetical protein